MKALINETLHNVWWGDRKTYNTQIRGLDRLFSADESAASLGRHHVTLRFRQKRSRTLQRLLQQIIKSEIRETLRDTCTFFFTCIYSQFLWAWRQCERVWHCWVCLRRSKQHISTGSCWTALRFQPMWLFPVSVPTSFPTRRPAKPPGSSEVWGPTCLLSCVPVTRRCFAEQAVEFITHIFKYSSSYLNSGWKTKINTVRRRSEVWTWVEYFSNV